MSLTGLLWLIAGSWVAASLLVALAWWFVAGRLKSHIHRGTRARVARSRIQLTIKDRKRT